MKASESFMLYCALKAHFERPSYDFFRYNGKVRAGDYESRKDKHFFFRASRAYNTANLRSYYVANFLAGKKHISGFSHDLYLAWKRKAIRLNEVYANDLTAIKELIVERGLKPKDVFNVKSGEHPILFRLLLGDYIQIETFVILTTLVPFLDRYDKVMADDPTWNEWSKKIRKYSPFLVQMLDPSWNFREVTSQKLLNTTSET